MTKKCHSLIALVMACCLVLFPVAANAATATLTCSNGSVSGGEFYDSSGSGACQATGLQHIVSQVVCSYVVIMDDIMGKVYCSMQYALLNVAAAVFTLYIAIFGVQILMGMTQLNAREIVMRFFKIAIVWLFISDSSWAVGVGFNFFVSALSDSVSWVVNPIAGAAGVPISTGGSPMPVYEFLDSFVSTTIFGPLMAANFKVIAFFVIIAHVYPALAMMAAYWLLETVFIVAHIMLGFLVSITAISFLIVLSPIFLCFMLFHSTMNFFEHWLKYMMAFVVQTTVVFAIAVMWLMITLQIVTFFNDLANVIVPYNQLEKEGEIEKVEKDFALCDAQLQQTTTGPTMGNANCGNLIPPSKWDEEGDYIYYLFYHLISLVLIAKAFRVMLKDAPRIAHSIAQAGSISSPLLGGWGTPGFVQGIKNKAMPTQQQKVNAFKQAGSAVSGITSQLQKSLEQRKAPN